MAHSMSWNEIRDRAIRFSREWRGERREEAEKQSFWNEFFDVFGIRRRSVASFEAPVRNIHHQYGYIDLFWSGKLLVEHKSFGKDLGRAESQAFRYIQDLLREGRQDEIPRYVIVSDFARVALHDLEPEDQLQLPLFDGRRVATCEFPLADLYRHIRLFAFLRGEKAVRLDPEDPANLKATAIMSDLHDTLAVGGYSGHNLERFLVRVLFCLFADHTDIFEPSAFQSYIESRTLPDGSDLGPHLAHLFEILDTPPDRRQKNLDEELAAFPYVNGGLFAERLPFASFNRDMRNALVASGRFNWSKISPAVFGSLFQGIMEPRERRQLGGHYTNERDIMKVVRSLFLDDLHAEFDAIKADRSKRRTTRLKEFQEKLSKLRFLDPACGCGNFLVLTYREMRLLEIEVLKELHGIQQVTDIEHMSRIDVDQMFGIEICEWPARIAEVALWLLDHQMNQRLSEAFGQYYVRLPITATPHIVCGNALRLNWKALLSPKECSYVLGNPPFVGKKEQTAEQKSDMDAVFGKAKGSGVLDYVCAWYMKAADYTQNTRIRTAFVSTNSITQGEQVGVLWSALFAKHSRLEIHFAHRTFAWQSEASGKAHVHVVIIGFAGYPANSRTIFEYLDPKGDPVIVRASRINPYLADAPNILIMKRTSPVNGAPGISYGSMANDRRKKDKGLGNLILDAVTRQTLLKESEALAPYIRPFVGSEEFINSTERWCLWLIDAPPALLRSSPSLRQRIEAVQQARQESNRPETRALARTPALFGENRQPDVPYLLIPKVSSETRPYLPIGFLTPTIIANGSSLIVPGASRFHFGILSSAMHMAWMRFTCGRLESRYQYSSQIVYNNYPWPQDATAKQRTAVETAAQAVLDARAKHFGTATLADLYDPRAMPHELTMAHEALDKAVDRCYRPEAFHGDRERVEYLFVLYEKITSPLLPSSGGSRSRKKTA